MDQKMSNLDEVVCIAEVIAQDGKAEELLKILRFLVEKTVTEIGCLRYELNQSLDDLHHFVVVEKYKNQAAFDFHGNTPYLQDFKDNVIKKLVKSINVKLYKEN